MLPEAKRVPLGKHSRGSDVFTALLDQGSASTAGVEAAVTPDGVGFSHAVLFGTGASNRIVDYLCSLEVTGGGNLRLLSLNSQVFLEHQIMCSLHTERVSKWRHPGENSILPNIFRNARKMATGLKFGWIYSPTRKYAHSAFEDVRFQSERCKGFSK